MLRQILNKRINSPLTSSAGRLFDAVASLTGVRHRINFEGQAAMELEFSIDGERTDETYPFRIFEPANATGLFEPQFLIDWEPVILEIINDTIHGISISIISAKFHNTLVEMIVGIAKRIGEERIILTGGCFQNRYLTERAVQRLEIEGFHPYWHQRVPPNDGGIALGQVFAVIREAYGMKNLVGAKTLNQRVVQ